MIQYTWATFGAAMQDVSWKEDFFFIASTGYWLLAFSLLFVIWLDPSSSSTRSQMHIVPTCAENKTISPTKN